jgi:hypothetical protein
MIEYAWFNARPCLASESSPYEPGEEAENKNSLLTYNILLAVGRHLDRKKYLLELLPQPLFAQNSVCFDFCGDTSSKVLHRLTTAPKLDNE